MEYNNLNLLDFHLGVIDGGTGGEGAPGGRIVCFNGTGNEPLFMATIDPTFEKCAPVVPVIEPSPLTFTPAVPEPSTVALLGLSLVIGRLWLLRRSARSDGTKDIWRTA